MAAPRIEQPPVKPYPEPFFKNPAACRKEKEQAGGVGEKTGGQQHHAGQKNDQGVEHLFGGHFTCGHAVLDGHDGLDALNSCQVGTGNGGEDHHHHGVEWAQGPPHLEQYIDFRRRHKGKSEKELEKHGTSFLLEVVGNGANMGISRSAVKRCRPHGRRRARRLTPPAARDYNRLSLTGIAPSNDRPVVLPIRHEQ